MPIDPEHDRTLDLITQKESGVWLLGLAGPETFEAIARFYDAECHARWLAYTKDGLRAVKQGGKDEPLEESDRLGANRGVPGGGGDAD